VQHGAGNTGITETKHNSIHEKETKKKTELGEDAKG